MGTGQLPAETVQAVVPSSQTPSDAPSEVSSVQRQVPQTGQSSPETGQEVPGLLPQKPARAPSKTEAVQLQVPHSTQVAGETVQEVPGLLPQSPSSASSKTESVQPQAPQTGQLLSETVQEVPGLLPQSPSSASSKTESVQPQAPQTGQLLSETVQEVPGLLPQKPAPAPSKTEAVHLQVPQTGQVAGETVQESPLPLQVPADAESKTEGVQLQSQGGGTTSQLFAATVQDRGGEFGQGSPPHPADTATVLDCVPASDASAVDAVHSQGPQEPHRQSRSCVPSTSLCVVSSQLPTLQPALQFLVLVWVKETSQAWVEAAGDHSDHWAVPQVISVSQYCVPVAPRLVEQSPVLQPALQVLLWVKGWPQQTVEVAGDHAAVPQLTGVTGFAAEQTPEFDPPLVPSQRHW